MDILLQHLPQILDLAANFNIELSGVLKDFAQKLHDDVPEINDGFSFPQAALIVEKCSEIYGRKVDYVYSLILDLSSGLNVRMHGQEINEQQEEPSLSPRKSFRRRKTLGSPDAQEDFQSMTVPLVNVKPITKVAQKRRGKRHTTEYVALRLQPCFLQTKEFHIYDHELSSIGTKDQFRLAWHIDNKCRLEEFIKNEGSGSSWNVCDVGVTNMPTPEYSDEGNAEDVLYDTLNGDSAETIYEKSQPLGTAIEKEMIQELGAKFTAVSHEETIAEIPRNLNKSTFKLPYELTAKGLRGAKAERNFTLFLFSDMLLRSLNMEGPLPLPRRERNEDKKMVARHVAFLQNRFNLDLKRPRNIDSILEPEPDFLGFEEQALGDAPEVLTAIESQPSTESSAPTSTDVNGEDDNFDFDTDSPLPMIPDCTSKKKPSVDENWKEFIMKKIGDDKKESDFDIHAYGSEIISTFSHVGETVSFAELAGGLKREEVSKHFLSVLMLANTENLSIQEGGPNTLQMTLLSCERHHDIEEELVPSCSSETGNGERPSSKRKGSNSIEEQPCDKRFRKQKPGVGPWVNKSKR